jgi:hypothetical protein
MSLLVVLVIVDMALAIGSIFGKVPGWAVDFAICVTLLVAFWGR